MISTAALRLLNDGLPGLRPEGEHLAEAFSPEELAASPLAPVSGASPAMGRSCPDTEWHEIRPTKELCLLECSCPELSAPLYLAGHATSSLDVAHALVCQGLLPEWGSVLVLSQSAGRGQLRRAWASPPGNIYAALRLPVAWPLNTAAAAPAVGSLFVEALKRMGYAAALKWPNDILQVKNEVFSTSGTLPPSHTGTRKTWAKAGGILLEERGNTLVAGVGLNICWAPPSSTLREGFALPATVLRRGQGTSEHRCHPTSQHAQNRTDCIQLVPFWISLAALVFSCYFQKSNEEGTWWPDLAQQHLAFRGCRVRLEDALPESDSGADRSSCEGVVEGLCASGALRLRVKSDVRTFLGGSLIPLE